MNRIKSYFQSNNLALIDFVTRIPFQKVSQSVQVSSKIQEQKKTFKLVIYFCLPLDLLID